MRAFLATLPAGLDLGERVVEDAAVIAAEAELVDAWNRHDHPDHDREEARRATLIAAGRRFADTPAVGPLGLAVKLHHLTVDVVEGHTRWSEALATGTRDDAVRLLMASLPTAPTRR